MPDIKEKSKVVSNYLKTVRFRYPEWIPCRVVIMPAAWQKYGEDLKSIVSEHPKIFPGYSTDEVNSEVNRDKKYQQGKFIDNWGCTWANVAAGLDGVVVDSPLDDWEKFENYQPPNPLKEGSGWSKAPDWNKIEEEFTKVKRNGGLARGYLPHGFMFMRLCYLRGFNNFMLDLAKKENRINKLIKMVLDYNLEQIKKYLEIGAEHLHFGDDLGFQDRLMISPKMFRRFLKPCYKKMFSLCKKEHVIVYFHSDGNIVKIIPDLIEIGVDILNPEIKANGVNGLKSFKGDVCLEVSLDCQSFPFMTEKEAKAHIETVIDKLNLPEGGLMLFAEIGPDIPLNVIKAILEKLEKECGPSLPYILTLPYVNSVS